jgi:hypothetical protein
MSLGKFNPNNGFLRLVLSDNVNDHSVLLFQYEGAIEEESIRQLKDINVHNLSLSSEKNELY